MARHAAHAAPISPRRRALRASGVLLVVAAVAVFIFIATRLGGGDGGTAVTAESARAGQCIDVFADDNDRIGLREVACEEEHDAQILLDTDVGSALADGVDVQTLDDAETVCPALLPDSDVAALDDYAASSDADLVYTLLIDDPTNLDDTDRLVCYVSPSEGTFSQPLIQR